MKNYKVCVVGAGTVITNDVPDYALVVGNLGKIIGWVDKKGNRLKFDNNGNSLCGDFMLANGILNKRASL